jgi:uncharacterized protein
MGTVRIDIAEDGSTATAVTTAPAPETQEADVEAALDRAGVTSGIDHDAVSAFVAASRTAPAKVVVARGRAAIDGADGRIDLHDGDGLRPGSATSDGRMDFHERRLLRAVEGGRTVATVAEPERGIDGEDVRGRRLVGKSGQPATVVLGAGVARTGGDIVARRSGVVLRTGKTIDVVDLYEHAGDVDYRSGNLHTTGSLDVRGDVREGFAATAAGDLCVRGAVLDGALEAGGSIHVEQGIVGAHCIATAGADLRCRHATSARLEAVDHLRIDDTATHCTLTASTIEVTQGRATILGGTASAGGRIVVGTAGTPGGAATVLRAGDVTAKMADFVRTTAKEQRVAEQAARRGSPPAGGPGKALRQAQRIGDPIKNRERELRRLAREARRAALVEVHDAAHVGVRVALGDASLDVTETVHHVRFRWHEERAEIVMEELP